MEAQQAQEPVAVPGFREYRLAADLRRVKCGEAKTLAGYLAGVLLAVPAVSLSEGLSRALAPILAARPGEDEDKTLPLPFESGKDVAS